MLKCNTIDSCNVVAFVFSQIVVPSENSVHVVNQTKYKKVEKSQLGSNQIVNKDVIF